MKIQLALAMVQMNIYIAAHYTAYGPVFTARGAERLLYLHVIF